MRSASASSRRVSSTEPRFAWRARIEPVRRRLDLPHAVSAVPAILLQHARTGGEARRQLVAQLPRASVKVRVAATSERAVLGADSRRSGCALTKTPATSTEQRVERSGRGRPDRIHQTNVRRSCRGACIVSRRAGAQRRLAVTTAGALEYGVNLVRLKPGAWSSQRHWHIAQDEFIYILSGEVTLVTNAGVGRSCVPAIALGSTAGDDDGHHLQNRSNADVTFIEMGTRRSWRRHVTIQTST